MKKRILKTIAWVAAIIILASCSKVKDWKCTIQVKGMSGEWSEGSVVYFTGTEEEMHAYEETGTYESDMGTFVLSVKTECE